MKKILGEPIFWVLVVLLACNTFPSLGCERTESVKASSTAVAKYTCVAGPDEVCPSDLWVTDYQKMKAIMAPYVAPQEKQDLANGIAVRLNREIPPGYYFDEKKLRFVKAQVSTNAPIASPPTPLTKK